MIQRLQLPDIEGGRIPALVSVLEVMSELSSAIWRHPVE